MEHDFSVDVVISTKNCIISKVLLTNELVSHTWLQFCFTLYINTWPYIYHMFFLLCLPALLYIV